MTLPPAPVRRFSERLGFRLGLVISLALLPIGVLTVQRTTDLLKVAQARSEAALAGETLRAAAPEVDLIRRGQGAANALAAAIPALTRDMELCRQAMRTLVAGSNRTVSFAGYTASSGLMECSSTDKVMDFRGTERFTQLMRDATPALTVVKQAAISKQPVVSYAVPVFAPDGSVSGIVSLSMPHAALIGATAPGGVPEGGNPIGLVTFDQDGNILTASVGLDVVQSILPAGLPLASLAKAESDTFTARANSGARRTFSVVPLASGQLYALGTWSVSQGYPDGRFAAFAPLLFPGLMWLAGLIAAWFATELLVIRHIRSLGRSMASFARGNRSVGEPDFRGAPQEIREVAESYLRMTDTILHDEAELEDMVHQKEVLLREVHHRVKNNLQLIASIMNMQIRKAHSPEAKVLMKSLQERVMSLATIHRGLYQTSGLTDIRADELLPDIVRQIVRIGSAPGRRFDVQTEFQDIRLTPDQAVPLALLLTEALTNAIKYAGVADGLPVLKVRLVRSGPTGVALSIENSLADNDGPPGDFAGTGTGLGMQLLAAFAHQLGATMTAGRDGGLYVLRLTFDVRPLAEAEARHATDPVQDAAPDE